MGRYRNLKGDKKTCPYCNGKVEWGGYDYDYEHPMPFGGESGEYKCTVCHFDWHEDGRAFTIKEANI